MHFSAIAEAANGLPLVFYNNPMRGGVRLPLSVMSRLIRDYDVFVGLKQSELSLLPESFHELGHRIQVIAKSERELLAGMAHGAIGALTFAGNIIPSELVSILEMWRSGDIAGSQKEYFRCLPVMNAIHLQPVPAAIHYMLKQLGWEVGDVRPPISPLTKDNQAAADGALAAVLGERLAALSSGVTDGSGS